MWRIGTIQEDGKVDPDGSSQDNVRTESSNNDSIK